MWNDLINENIGEKHYWEKKRLCPAIKQVQLCILFDRSENILMAVLYL